MYKFCTNLYKSTSAPSHHVSLEVDYDSLKFEEMNVLNNSLTKNSGECVFEIQDS